MAIEVVSRVSSYYMLKQLLVAFICNAFCVGSGCTLGYSAVLLPQIKNEEGFPYNASYDSWIASSSCLAMIVGSICGGLISDKYGRKFAQLIVPIPYVIGWLFLAFAYNTTFLIIGRILTGLCTTLFKSLGAVNLSEISSPRNRPLFIFSLTMSGNSGILISHILGGYFSRKLTCLIICLPVILGWCLLFLVKESPLWLIYKGRIDEGIAGFLWFRGNDESSQKELADVLEKMKDRPPELSFKEGVQAMFTKSFLMPLLTISLLFITVQFCGVNSMSFYAQDLLNDTFSGDLDPFMLMLVTDFAKMCGVGLLYVITKYIQGRRNAHLTTSTTIVILLVGLIAYIAIKPSGLAWLALLIIICYVILGSMIICLAWSYIGEIFPSNLRGLGSGLGAATSSLFLFLSVLVSSELMRGYGIILVYATDAVLTFIAVFFLYFLLPHNDGKSLQEIEDSYDKK